MSYRYLLLFIFGYILFIIRHFTQKINTYFIFFQLFPDIVGFDIRVSAGNGHRIASYEGQPEAICIFLSRLRSKIIAQAPLGSAQRLL